MVSHFDSLLTHLGTGRWSVLHYFATSLLSIFVAPHALGGALLSPRLDFSCRVPSSITLHDTTSFPSFLQDSNSSSADDQCEYRIHTPDGERTEKCVEFDFDNSTYTSTFTSEYNLACGRSYLQTFFQSIYMLGIFIGAPITGYISDRFIDESPRWLFVNGHHQEAFRVLSKVARWHGVGLPAEPDMKRLAEEMTPKVNSASQQKSLWVLLKAVIDESVVLVRTPRLRIITLCIMLAYLVASMVYFGLSLSGASISDDPFMFMVLSGLMEVPAYTLTVPVVEHFGRKLTMSVLLFINAGVLFALAFTPAVYSITVIALAMIGKLAITGGFQTIIFFSSELFPTEVRSRGMGVAFMMSRIGVMVSPFITDLVGVVYPWAPFVIFAFGAFLAGAGTFLLPETRGQILTDSVAQLEDKVREAPKE